MKFLRGFIVIFSQISIRSFVKDYTYITIYWTVLCVKNTLRIKGDR